MIVGGKNWAYTDLSVRNALYLELEGGPDQWTRYEVVQFTASWSCNEFPRAQCLLAVGRRGSPASTPPARVHNSRAHRRRCRARIWFRPQHEYRPDGTLWPDEPRIIFLGKFLGFSPRKVHGRMHVTATLEHWLSDLASSSALTQNGHVGNPAIFNAAAVLNAPRSTGASRSVFLSHLVPGTIAAADVAGVDVAGTDVASDLWSTMKRIFCALAEIPTAAMGLSDACLGSGDVYINSRALNALGRVEGGELRFNPPPPPPPSLTPTGDAVTGGLAESLTDVLQPVDNTAGNSLALDVAIQAALLTATTGGPVGTPAPGTACSLPYVWGRPLQMDTLGLSTLEDAIADALGNAAVTEYAGTTFWDKLVGEFMPMFGMSVVPLVETALVIAHVPTYREAWKTIEITEHDSFDANFSYEKPVRAVGVIATWTGQTGAYVDDGGGGGSGEIRTPDVGGCYVEESVAEDTGQVIYVQPPPWLIDLGPHQAGAGSTTGLDTRAPSRSSTTPGNTPPGPAFSAADMGALGQLHDRWARDVYSRLSLRERQASFAGKLRFDIAPGSIVHLKASAELFLGDEDELATDIYANVARVTVSIDAESGQCGTVFQLTHVRTADENTRDATSSARHALFTPESIHGSPFPGQGRHGAPLVTEYNL